MNGDGGWVERFNSTVRGFVTLLLTGTFCLLAYRKDVDPGIFANVLSTVVAFWFAAKAAERLLEQSTGPTPVSTPGMATKTEKTEKTETAPSAATPPPTGATP